MVLFASSLGIQNRNKHFTDETVNRSPMYQSFPLITLKNQMALSKWRYGYTDLRAPIKPTTYYRTDTHTRWIPQK